MVGEGGGLGASPTIDTQQSLEVAGDAEIRSDGVLTLAGGSLKAGGRTLIRAGGVLQGHGVAAGRLAGEQFSQISASGGSLLLGDPMALDGFQTEGILEVGSAEVVVSSLSYATLGGLTTLGGGTLKAANGLALSCGASLRGWGSVMGPVAGESGSTIYAAGDLQLGDDAAPDGVQLSGRLVVGPHLVTLTDSNKAVLGSLTDLAGGTLRAARGLLVPDTSNITGHGLLDANVWLDGAILSDAAGFEITGDVIFGEAAELTALLDGFSLCGLSIGGDAELDGRLFLQLGQDFVPAPGSDLTILTARAVSGIFQEIALQEGPAGLWFEPIYLADRVKLMQCALGGDANLDGSVGIGDLAVLAGNWYEEGMTWGEGDFTGDGWTTLGDLSLLAASWDSTLSLPAGVPEPTTFLLLALGGMALLRLRQ